MVAEVIPSQFIASATYNALLTVLPSCRQFTRKASRKSIGYDLSSGLFCHSCLTMLQLNKASALEVAAWAVSEWNEKRHTIRTFSFYENVTVTEAAQSEPLKVHLCIQHHRFCYVGNKIGWNRDSIHFLQMALNVSTAHPVWVHSLKLNDWTKCKLWKLFNSCAKRAYVNERVCELANSIFITATDGGSDNSSDILAWAKISYQTMYKDVHCLMSAPF